MAGSSKYSGSINYGVRTGKYNSLYNKHQPSDVNILKIQVHELGYQMTRKVAKMPKCAFSCATKRII